jgi:chromosome partitioning protein
MFFIKKDLTKRGFACIIISLREGKMEREMKIGVVGNKGGTGKTFIAVNLAYGLAKVGEKVLFIDCDIDQHSGLNWFLGRWNEEGGQRDYMPEKKYKVRENLEAIWLDELKKIEEFEPDGYTIYIYDGRPAMEVTARILAKVDRVILPVDLSDDTIYQAQTVREAIGKKQDVVVYVIINKLTGTKISQNLVNKIEKMGFFVIGSMPYIERVKYAELNNTSIYEVPRIKLTKIPDMFDILAGFIKRRMF